MTLFNRSWAVVGATGEGWDGDGKGDIVLETTGDRGECTGGLRAGLTGVIGATIAIGDGANAGDTLALRGQGIRYKNPLRHPINYIPGIPHDLLVHLILVFVIQKTEGCCHNIIFCVGRRFDWVIFADFGIDTRPFVDSTHHDRVCMAVKWRALPEPVSKFHCIGRA